MRRRTEPGRRCRRGGSRMLTGKTGAAGRGSRTRLGLAQGAGRGGRSRPGRGPWLWTTLAFLAVAAGSAWAEQGGSPSERRPGGARSGAPIPSARGEPSPGAGAPRGGALPAAQAPASAGTPAGPTPSSLNLEIGTPGREKPGPGGAEARAITLPSEVLDERLNQLRDRLKGLDLQRTDKSVTLSGSPAQLAVA